eukprot:TRINITY_DN16330_c0_g1_i1.p1 TRINITY_DN16330_c0_g1~~TRINITY_DN16330_c0_g1_i1.p1  ORF type:complete len:286 (+),score=27.96 TRINITY_DN16330_c0_g1_i1:96-953(+)
MSYSHTHVMLLIFVAVCLSGTFAQSAAETNLRAPVLPHSAPVEHYSEDTDMVTEDIIREIHLSCQPSSVINTPVLCRIKTFDDCGNEEGTHGNSSSMTPSVSMVAGSTDLDGVKIFVSDVVHKGGNAFGFQFLPTKIGVYRVGLNSSDLPRRYRDPDSVMVAVRDLVQKCSEMPRIDQTRRTLQSMLRVQDLDTRVGSHTSKQFVVPNIDLGKLQQEHSRTAAEHNNLVNSFNDKSRSSLPRTHLWPELGHIHPNPLFEWTHSPPDTFPKTRDFICQVGQRTLPD